MSEEHPGSLLHGLHVHLGSGGHRRHGSQLQGVEVKNSIDDAVGGTGPSADQNGQTVERSINHQSIAMSC